MRDKRAFAVGRRWWESIEKPVGGYVLVREGALRAAWHRLAEGEIQLRDFRAWLACFELRARRGQLDTSRRRPTFTPEELGRLVGCPQARLVRASARRLEACGLAGLRAHRLTLRDGKREAGMGRLVPIPRRLLRLLCEPHSKAFIATVLGHVLRCLFYRRGVIISGGYCKASELAEAFGISERAVRDNRQLLLARGLVTAFDADQRRLNRLGLPARFNLSSAEHDAPVRPAGRTSPAPRSPCTGTLAAGPVEHKNPSIRKINNQNPAKHAWPDRGGREGRTLSDEPRLQKIRPEDLTDTARLLRLHEKAVAAGAHPPGEGGRLCFVAMAEHALSCGTDNPPGLFAWLVKHQRAGYPTLGDEDAARRRLRGMEVHPAEQEQTQAKCASPVHISSVFKAFAWLPPPSRRRRSAARLGCRHAEGGGTLRQLG